MGQWKLSLCAPFSRRRRRNAASDAPKSTSIDDTSAASDKLPTETTIEPSQEVLLLHEVRGRYELVSNRPIPEIRNSSEVLVKTAVIGLNPIDWKAPDYNFGIPELPYISGREVVGLLVDTDTASSHLRPGERVLVISTDYRDLRKSGFQNYVVGSHFNIVRLPPRVSSEAAAGLGVAFVAAALSLGVCAGLDFSDILGGPNLLELLGGLDPAVLPSDVRDECLRGIGRSETIRRGDWLALWGGSSTSAFIACQLARLAGIKVISILDLQKHGSRQARLDAPTRPDLLVDNADTKRAIDITRAATNGRLRFGIDFVGRQTATDLLACLAGPPEEVRKVNTGLPSHKATQPEEQEKSVLSHLIGLTGLPKGSPPPGCVYHSVPIKVFHEVPALGSSLVLWLERLLEQGLIQLPSVLSSSEGLHSVNSALDKMRRGEISGGRAVVTLGTGD